MSERTERIGRHSTSVITSPTKEGSAISGLQGQRTELAWLRTMLSSWVVAVLTTRVAFPLGIIAMTGPVAVTAIAHARRRQLGRDGTPPALSRSVATLVALACVMIAIAAIVMVF